MATQGAFGLRGEEEMFPDAKGRGLSWPLKALSGCGGVRTWQCLDTGRRRKAVVGVLQMKGMWRTVLDGEGGLSKMHLKTEPCAHG
jgi:hypothetical protein